MSGEHYFTPEPAAAADRRPMAVELAGRRLSVAVAGGVFSPGRVDSGTQVLLREVPDPPAQGDLLDLGCGWGPVSLALAIRSPHATVYAVDVNERALDLTRANAAANGLANVVALRPESVPEEVGFAAIWSNPPIRVGKAELHAMLRQWLPRLAPGAAAYLVVQKNLGADSLQRWVESDLAMPCTRYAVAKGFRVLRVTPAG